MLRSRASGCFLALGGCVGVKVLYDCVFQALGHFFSCYHIIQQHTAVVRVVSSIGLSSTAVVVIVPVFRVYSTYSSR